MPKTPYEAFDALRSSLQRAVSCVNREAHLWALPGSNGYSPGQPHALVPNKGTPLRLKGERQLGLIIEVRYHIVRVAGEQNRWTTKTSAYYHSLETADEKEIVSFHWHPGEGSRIVHPHMHLGARIGANLGMLDKTHIPTGAIRLEDILRFAIRELGTEPQRDDWRGVLAG